MIRRRAVEWQDADPSSLLTKRVEKATAPLQWLVALMLPDRLVHEVLGTTLRAAELLTDRADVIKGYDVERLDDIFELKIDSCDRSGDQVQFWAVGAAAALGAWDKVQAIKAIKKIENDVAANPNAYAREDVDALIEKVAHAVGEHLTRRRTLASIPAMGALVGTSTNAWLLQDVGWAARNIYATRRFQKRVEDRAEAQEKKKVTDGGIEEVAATLPKAA
ncbi:MAG: EcsC family protein [Deltaproteobacteria bacterium]|nr:EcsC family protein [Deltaproteobacteria bacterium]